MWKKERIKPLIKWTGGKSSELSLIKEFSPEHCDRYFEPFLGGGSVWLASDASEMLVNDYSPHLYNFWQMIISHNDTFITLLENTSRQKKLINAICYAVPDHLVFDLGTDPGSKELKNLFTIISNGNETYKKHLEQSAITKYRQIRKHDAASDKDFLATSLHAGWYSWWREIFNTVNYHEYPELHAISYLIMKTFAYSGMYRLNKRGQFNSPYGGRSYNSKNLDKLISRISDNTVIQHCRKTTLSNQDFSSFLQFFHPNKNDFVFLDPPYDSTFVNYDGNEFTIEDHKRLAKWMECSEAQWMMVVSETEVINEIYKPVSADCHSFDKQYMVNFKGRNNREVNHLILTNYKPKKVTKNVA